MITPADLPPDLATEAIEAEHIDSLADAVARFEKQHIERILAQTPDKKEAARRLDMGLSSLYRRIAELGIQSSSQ
ncbi:MAG: helix-turn-helix domain-containing protein [Gemmataceae bacterium]